MRRTLSLTIVALALAVPAFAQSTPAAAAPAAPSANRAVAQGGRGGTVVSSQTPPAAMAAKVDAGLDPSDANISVQVTVTDKPSGVGAATVTRSGQIMFANQNSGSLRGLTNMYGSTAGDTKLDALGVDIDARGSLRKSGMAYLSLTVAYLPAGQEIRVTNAQRQSVTVYLKPGTDTQVLTIGDMKGAGPAVTISARVTIQK